MKLSQFLEGSFLIAGGLFAIIWALNLFLVRSPARLMGWILLIASIWLFAGAYMFTGIYLEYPYFYGIHLPIVFISGPLFYYYYKKIILEEDVEKFYLHLIPAILVLVSIIPYHFLPTVAKIDFLQSILKKQPSLYAKLLLSLNLGTKIYLISYLGVILWENRNLIRDSKEISNKSKFLFLFMSALLYIDLVIGLIGFILGSFILIKISALLLPLNIYIFFLISSKYPEMLLGIQKEIKKGRYEQSKIKSLDVNSILNQIKLVMETEKAFTDEDITLSQLAEELKITSHQLSQIINEKLNQTFPQFINEYRISEAKKMILEEKTRSVLSIAYAVGFNSKASFNRTFKQVTGITPQQFRKNYS